MAAKGTQEDAKTQDQHLTFKSLGKLGSEGIYIMKYSILEAQMS